MTKKRWQMNEPNEAIVNEIEQHLNIPKISAKILAARGFTTGEEAKAFLHMDESIVHDPFLMHGMEEAVARIQQAIAANEKIVVYGDYDAGATRF